MQIFKLTDMSILSMDEKCDKEVLIKALRKYQCIWKVNCKDYKDLKTRENAWKTSQRRLVSTGSDAKRNGDLFETGIVCERTE